MKVPSARGRLAGALAIGVALATWSSGAEAQYIPGPTFDDPSVTFRDEFGFSVAIDGNHVVIGAFNHDVPGQGPNDGQAHLFNATTGALVHTFDEPTPTSSSQFGQAVAVSGNHVVVGAPFDDSTAVNGGQAHLFNATTGALVHTLDDPTPTVVDNFGFSVAVDGDNILIGAPGHGLVGFVFGQAHLFDATTGLLSRTFDNPTSVNGDDFGCSVAIDGNNVVIGACRADTAADTDVGQAYLFDAVTGTREVAVAAQQSG